MSWGLTAPATAHPQRGQNETPISSPPRNQTFPPDAEGGQGAPRAQQALCTAGLLCWDREEGGTLSVQIPRSLSLTEFLQILLTRYCLICSLSSGPFPDPLDGCFVSICW